MAREKTNTDERTKERRGELQEHGDKIRDIRKWEQLSQENLAEMVGIDVTTLRQVEAGEKFLSSAAAITLYLEFGYSLDWIYGISRSAKNQDSKYFVDIRDMVQIKNGEVNISIQGKFYKFLAHVEKSEDIKALQMDEDCIPFITGIGKQERKAFYWGNEDDYYYAKINVQAFERKTRQEKN